MLALDKGTPISAEAMSTARSVAAEMAQQARAGRQIAKMSSFSDEQREYSGIVRN